VVELQMHQTSSFSSANRLIEEENAVELVEEGEA